MEKIHGSAFQRAGIPDLDAVVPGLTDRSIRIEVKKPGEVPTELQKRTMLALAKAGAYAFVARSVEDVAWAFNFIRLGMRPIDLLTRSLDPCELEL